MRRLSIHAAFAVLMWWIGCVAAVAQAEDLKAHNERVRALYQAGKWVEGRAAAEKYVEAARVEVGESSPRYATAISWLADFHRAQGHYSEAETLFKKALAIAETARGPDHSDVASYASQLARVYDEQMRFAEAEPLLQRALAITEKLRGTEHADVAHRLVDLGQLYSSMNRPAEAGPILERAVTVIEKARGPEHPEVGVLLRSVARVYGGREETRGQAEALYKRSLAIAEKAYGSEDVRIVNALVSFADFYRLSGRRPAEAEPLYKRALAITEKARGPDHIDVAIRLNSLALVLSAQKRFAEAEPLSVRALAITEKTLGPDHPSVGPRLYNLAHYYEHLGRYVDAEKALKRAIALGEKTLGPEHIAVATRMSALARVYEVQGRNADAEPLYRRSLAINEKVYGVDHPQAVFTGFMLGGFYKAVGRRDEAEPLVKRALVTVEKLAGPNEPMLAYFLTQLGDLYRLRGQCDLAEPLFVRALSISKEDLQEVTVLFGTDRKPEGDQPSISFGGERGTTLSLGLAVVTMPRPELDKPNMHMPGEVADPSPSEASRRLGLRCIQIVKDKQLIEAAARRLTVSTAFPNQAFVYVHGYNVSFDNAIRRAAQIAYDLKFDGGAFLFSWPSRGKLDIRAYFMDRDTVDIAAEHLREFLETVVAETKPRKIHFVAHSMGNLVLLHALEKIGNQSPTLRGLFGEIIQAAPDVDADVFTSTVLRLKAGSQVNLTLYASRSDRALWLSGWLRNGARAGYISREKPLIVRGVDTIDITTAGTGLFGVNHDVYTASPSVIADMRRIFATGERPPDKRTKELEPVVSKDGTFWRLRAN